MAGLNATPGSGQVAGTHTATVHYEKDLWYWGKAPEEDSREGWLNDLLVASCE